MDLKTLEALGINISKEEIEERIVDQAVSTLLHTTGWDPENERETRYESKFKREIEKRVQEAVDAKIGALAAEHLIPRVGELIEKTNMRKTNQYGEPKGESMTFIEYIASRANVYMTENVDHNGKSKEESGDSYNWRASGPRLTVLMKMYIRDTMEAAAKTAINDVNKVIAKNIEKAALEAIHSTAANLKVSVSA